MPYAATIGFFDGVHRGHQFVIEQLIHQCAVHNAALITHRRFAQLTMHNADCGVLAQSTGLRSANLGTIDEVLPSQCTVGHPDGPITHNPSPITHNPSPLQPAVITFETHPRSVLHADYVPQLLCDFDERVELLKNTGLKEIFAFNFEVIRDMTAEEFMRVLVNQCDVKLLLMGYDHHFGSDHLPSFEAYQQAAERVGLKLMLLPKFEEVSSTRIRSLLEEGNIEMANELLTYPYAISGMVVEGRHIGTQIGFPTANIEPSATKLIPRAGVYEVDTDFGRGILNIGSNPTVGGLKQTLEVHILNFTGSLYGERLTVRLLRYIREERKFASLDELQHQITRDIQALH